MIDLQETSRGAARASLDEQFQAVGVGARADNQGYPQPHRRVLGAQGLREAGILRGCAGHVGRAGITPDRFSFTIVVSTARDTIDDTEDR